MNMNSARALLVRDRLDWRRPHLSWISRALYGFGLRRR